MFCFKCGMEIKEGDLFCPQCGTKQEFTEVENGMIEVFPDDKANKRRFNKRNVLCTRNIFIGVGALVLIIGVCIWGKWYSDRWYRALRIVEDYNYCEYYTGEVNDYEGKKLRQVAYVNNVGIVNVWTGVNKNIPIFDEIETQFDVKEYKDICAIQFEVKKSENDEFITYFVFGCNSSKKNVSPEPIGIVCQNNDGYAAYLENMPNDVITIMYDWITYLNALYMTDYKNYNKEDWYENNILPRKEYSSENVLKLLIQKAESGQSDSVVSRIINDGSFDQDILIGETIELATINVTVLSCNEYSSLRAKYTQTPEAAPVGSKYVVYEVEVENITGKTIDDWDFVLTLIDSKDRVFEIYEKDYRYTDNNFEGIQLLPNVPTVGYMIYNVPQDCSDYYMYVNKAGTNRNYRLLGK